MTFTEYGGKDKCELLYFQACKDCATEKAITDEMNFLQSFMKDSGVGGASDHDGNELRNSSGVYVTDLYNEKYHSDSSIIQTSKNIVDAFFGFAKTNLYGSYGIFGRPCKSYDMDVMANGYKAGGNYGIHRDLGDITIMWFPQQGEYEGGELVLHDFNLKVDIHSFHGVVFPSFYRHEVLPVITDSKKYERFSVATFVTVRS